MSKCKPGDLAIVLRGCNKGKIVTVVKRPIYVKTVNGLYKFEPRSPRGLLHTSFTMDCWLIEGKLITIIQNREGVQIDTYEAEHGVMPDSYLQPISGPGIKDNEYSEIELKNQGKLRSERLADKMIRHGAMYDSGSWKKNVVQWPNHIEWPK